MADVAAKGFVTVSDLGGKGKYAATKLGGRVDFAKEINNINVVLSVTDGTLTGYETNPWKDVIFTAEKKVDANTTVGVGYDVGVRSALASVQTTSNVGSQTVKAKATWFEKGNIVRAEGTLRVDARNSVSGCYTFNDSADLANSTFINLREREGFIISPFMYPVATAAVKYTLEANNGYTFEPAYDINRGAGYLSVQKQKGNSTIRAQYGFAEETALLEVGHRPTGDLPPLKAYVKAPLGLNHLGPLSFGVMVDKTFYL